LVSLENQVNSIDFWVVQGNKVRLSDSAPTSWQREFGKVYHSGGNREDIVADSYL
jgi:hypothetical protein